MARRRRTYDADDPQAVAARRRVIEIIDHVPPEELVAAIKQAPSLRGMILGYVAELMFEKHLPERYPFISRKDILSHDDHDRSRNKSDRTIRVGERLYRVQLKSIQTNSIRRNLQTGLLQAEVQNDASDSRRIRLPSGNMVLTTCYARGDYDILAVPLFPFTGDWSFAYKRNLDCRATTSRKYAAEDAAYLLATTETITWPLRDDWHQDLSCLLDDRIGLRA